MKKADYSAFQDAAQENVQPDVDELLDVGETGWLLGRPIESDKGTVALQTPEGFQILVSKRDVIEYREHNDQFFLRIKYGTSVVTRLENVKNIVPSRPGEPCDCEDRDTSPPAQLQQLRQGDNTIGDTIDDIIRILKCIRCEIVYEEVWCELEGGIRFRCYKPVIRCRNICVYA